MEKKKLCLLQYPGLAMAQTDQGELGLLECDQAPTKKALSFQRVFSVPLVRMMLTVSWSEGFTDWILKWFLFSILSGYLKPGYRKKNLTTYVSTNGGFPFS